MLLAIDSGNTNTVFGLFDGDSLLGQWRMVTNAHRTADEYAVWLGEMLGLDNRTLKDINGVVIATVVPQVISNLRQLCERYCCCKPIITPFPTVRYALFLYSLALLYLSIYSIG